VVPVTIDGKGPFPFVLDTGASATVVSRSLADKLALPKAGGTVSGMGAGGAVGFTISRIRSLAIGDASLQGLEVAVGDVPAIGQADGILGYNFLSRFRFTIDYNARAITFAR
jgi:predicted aspartyl protease